MVVNKIISFWITKVAVFKSFGELVLLLMKEEEEQINLRR